MPNEVEAAAPGHFEIGDDQVNRRRLKDRDCLWDTLSGEHLITLRCQVPLQDFEVLGASSTDRIHSFLDEGSISFMSSGSFNFRGLLVGEGPWWSAGNGSQNGHPNPLLLFTSIDPPWEVMIPWTTARPSPVPCPHPLS